MSLPASASPVEPNEVRRLAWAVVARAGLSAPQVVDQLLTEGDAEEVAARLALAGTDFGLPADLRDRAARDLEQAEQVGGRLRTPEDTEWPADRLHALNAAHVAGRAPLGLWLRGPARLDSFAGHTVAVVGSRAASDYGHTVTHDFAGYFAEHGWTVLSGGAFGIDAAAHRAALIGNGATVAVAATGIDRYYPSGNRELLARIADTGLLVSEYPPGETARRHRFPERNRLIAALAAGVLVVEAGLRSGSTSTVAWANTLARPVFAVPGSIYSAASAGVHNMLREHRVQLVTDPRQVIDALVRSTPPVSTPDPSPPVPAAPGRTV